jgi:hypothetical protein
MSANVLFKYRRANPAPHRLDVVRVACLSMADRPEMLVLTDMKSDRERPRGKQELITPPDFSTK